MACPKFAIVTEIRAPEKAWLMIKAFWEMNNGKAALENWGVGKKTILHGNIARRQWEGTSLTVCSLYYFFLS
jgi:hypothetical protein